MPQRLEQPLSEHLKLILVDSITQMQPSDRDAVIVTGSHGGVSVVDYVVPILPLICFFNDAGIGKDEAGIKALPLLAAHGLAAATYSHISARIGDAQDGWRNGVITHCNDQALHLGLRETMQVHEAIQLLLSLRA
jgi:hypothetical protein